MDTSSLTTRERQLWSTLVSEILAPCPDQAMTLGRCLDVRAPCPSCVPAAHLLVSQLQRGRTAEQLKAAVDARFAADAAHEIPIEGSPARGATVPQVTIVEWADFGCPYCAASAQTLHALVRKYPERVKVVFKHYPLESHPGSDLAARAAVAATLQGKFWEIHDRLFGRVGAHFDEAAVTSIAEEARLDVAELAKDLKSPAVQHVVQRDRQQADRLGLKGTPMIFVNGRLFDLKYFNVGQDLEPWVQLEFELASAKPHGPPRSSPSKAPPPPAAPAKKGTGAGP